MKLIKNDHIIEFDIDGTLILWEPLDGIEEKDIVSFRCPHTGDILRARIHHGHCRLLKEKKFRGYYIRVHSQGGWSYACAVIRALNLTGFVDEVCTKPGVYVDDIPVEHWHGPRIFLDPNKKYKGA